LRPRPTFVGTVFGGWHRRRIHRPQPPADGLGQQHFGFCWPGIDDAGDGEDIDAGVGPFKDKIDCIVLDHSGNVRRLGDPREIDYSSLDTGDEASAEKREKDEAGTPEAIFCSQCHAQLPCPKPRKCPDCGEIF
jgi:hypothetical protein